MRIAVLSENVADRKHLERLLGREEAYFSNEDPIYVDSYGNSMSLLSQPVLYDLYLICPGSQEVQTPLSTLLHTIKEKLPEARLAVCQSANTPAPPSDFDSVFTIQAPITHEKLSQLLQESFAQKKQAEPVFEIRGRAETRYIHADEFVYAREVNKRQSKVTLQNNVEADFLDSFTNLTKTMSNHPSLFLTGSHFLLNLKYVKKCYFFSLVMNDATRIPASLPETLLIKKLLKNPL